MSTLSRLRAARPSSVRRVAWQVARFVLHFVEMILAMELGMVALGGFDTGILRPAGLNLTGRSPEMDVLAMGVFMAAPMVAWMRLRGHGWRHGLEMAAAMVVPFAGAVALRCWRWWASCSSAGATTPVRRTRTERRQRRRQRWSRRADHPGGPRGR